MWWHAGNSNTQKAETGGSWVYGQYEVNYTPQETKQEIYNGKGNSLSGGNHHRPTFVFLFPHHCTSVSSISPLHYFAKASHFSQRESMTKEDEINTQVCYTLEFP